MYERTNRPGMPARATVWIAVLATLITACEPPAGPQPQGLSTGELGVFMILHPDRDVQSLTLQALVEHGATLEAHADVVELLPSGEERVVVPSTMPGQHGPCYFAGLAMRSTPAALQCITLPFRPRYGARYRIRVTSPGRPTATAVTGVPGDFDIARATAERAASGSMTIDAGWTASEGAHRFVVGVYPEAVSSVVCDPDGDCRIHPRADEIVDLPPWYRATNALEVDTTVPADALPVAGVTEPWYLIVAAMDRALFEFLTTGNGGQLFPTPPRQNVRNGFGVVGSWVRRAVPVLDAP